MSKMRNINIQFFSVISNDIYTISRIALKIKKNYEIKL